MKLPAGTSGELIADLNEKLPLEPGIQHGQFKLPAGKTVDLKLGHTWCRTIIILKITIHEKNHFDPVYPGYTAVGTFPGRL